MDSAQTGLLTVNDVAVALGVSRASVRRWIASRIITTVKVGPRLVRVSRAEVERLIRAGTRPALSPSQRSESSRQEDA